MDTLTKLNAKYRSRLDSLSILIAQERDSCIYSAIGDFLLKRGRPKIVELFDRYLSELLLSYLENFLQP